MTGPLRSLLPLLPLLPFVPMVLIAPLAAEDVAPAPAPTPAPAAPAAVADPAAPTAAPAPTAPAAAPLTLAEVLARAQMHNATREVAQARLDRVLALRQQAYSLLRPSVVASGGYTNASQADLPWANRPSQTWSGVGQVSVSLFNAAAWPAVAAADKNVESQRLSSRELERSLAFAVARTFIGIVAAERQLDAADRRRTVAVRSVSDARARAEAGLSSQNDATRAQLELANADLAVTTARQSLATSRLALAELMGGAADATLAEPPAADILSRDPRQLEPFALQHREDLASARLQIDVERRLAQQYRLGIVPTLGVTAGYSSRHLVGSSIPSAGLFGATDPTWSVALTAQWTLYDGGQREAQAAGHDASRRENAALYADTLAVLHRDIATALVNLESAEASVNQAGVRLTVAQTNAKEVQARSEQGLATALEVADAIASQFQSESDLASRRFDLESSRYEIRRLLGLWPLDANGPAGAKP